MTTNSTDGAPTSLGQRLYLQQSTGWHNAIPWANLSADARGFRAEAQMNTRITQ